MGRLSWVVGSVTLTVLPIFACGDDPTTTPAQATDAGVLEASPNPTPGDATPPDTTAPGKVTDLAGTGKSPAVVALTWTAPSDESGRAAAYELKFSKNAITDEASFNAANTALPGPPAPAGTKEATDVLSLEADTEYHFAIRARDAAGNKGPISNEAVVRTKPRATLLVSEIALTNSAAQGSDFVELVVTKAGNAEGIEVRQAGASLHKLAAIELAVGDRIVVHLTGLPGPAGFQQEDAAKSKTASTAEIPAANGNPAVVVHAVEAYDVYSAATGISASDNLIEVLDGPKALDAVALSNRDGDAPTSTMNAFAKAKTDKTWSFTDDPKDGTTDCSTQREAVNIGTAESVCGGFDANVVSGISLNRNGLTDTNSKANFYVAPQSPGLANTAVPTPKLLGAIATSTTTIDLRFDQELAPATVVATAFTLTPSINVTAAALSAPNRVTLTTAPQVDPAYVVTLAATVTNTHGLAPTPLGTRLCAFTAQAAVLTLSEVNANIPGNMDLVELQVQQGGALAGFQVRANPTAVTSGTAVATLPGICAATGDIIVVHLMPAAAPAASESVTKSENAAALYPFNYDNAWDIRGAAAGLAMTNTILAVRNPAGAWIDAAVFTNGSMTSATSRDALAFVQAQGLWLPASCGGAACTDATTPTAQAIAGSWTALGTTSATSIRKTGATKDATAWSVGASSFGQP